MMMHCLFADADCCCWVACFVAAASWFRQQRRHLDVCIKTCTETSTVQPAKKLTDSAEASYDDPDQVLALAPGVYNMYNIMKVRAIA